MRQITITAPKGSATQIAQIAFAVGISEVSVAKNAFSIEAGRKQGKTWSPLLPLMLSIGFGIWTRKWRLVGQGLFSLVIAMLLLGGGGVIVGLLTNPPVQYSDFNSLATGFLVSLAVKEKALKFFKMNSGKTESRSTRPELRITNSATGGANE